MPLNIGLLLVLSIISGILGRMGGAEGFNTKYRDLGVPAVFVAIMCLFTQIRGIAEWSALVISALLLFGALTTYWQKLFSEDNLWFSGFICGLATMPLLWCGIALWAIIARALLLAVIWGLLNRYRKPILIWRGDVVEEFLRYFSLILTLLIFLI